MLVKHLFGSLMERLDEVEERWVAAESSEQKQTLRKELFKLRQMSDDILDSWLSFEEQLSVFDKQMQTEQLGTDDTKALGAEKGPFKEIPDDVADKILQEIKNMAEEKPSSNMVSFMSGDVARMFRKGQGYYNLLMYPHASDHFREVLEQEPDLDVARMFLAFSELMNGSIDEADRHFYLLSKTTDQYVLQATALNAQGCIMAARREWEKADHFFEQAIALYPKLKDPHFNRALVWMELGQYSKAKPIWLQLAKQDQEDWEALIQLAHCYIAEGEEDKANYTLTQIRNTADDREALVETAKIFERMRQFGNAALCFQMALQEDPYDADAWHGLGWNLWHADGQPLGVDHIQKAIELAPEHPDYQFSYGWILYHQRAYEEAEDVFRTLLDKDPGYTLALAGLAQVLTSKQQWEEAEALCYQMIGESHPPIKSLGYFQAGRMAMARANYERAQRYFSESVQLDPSMKDGRLWLGLAHYLNGERDRAREVWEEHF
ncbi:hypothetical protein BEP19_02060 [Ammoniphilus oxalaticus]|uniref:Uncharacterized protein n=1 Tax=Ammoniphilus oxalaticus TaxID=66863 RepID=A0A419SNF7_9BACL|nr:tetratricopeptide repeat protein [Ammoniphilus oxalaticus]RKD25749.1 hypothetical protein BEP19_02060 [Ammoniphilus oxalaticus]